LVSALPSLVKVKPSRKLDH